MERDLYVLLERYLDNRCSAADVQRLYEYFGHPDDDARLAAAIREYMIRHDAANPEIPPIAHEIAGNVHQRVWDATQPVERRPIWRRIPRVIIRSPYAAAILIAAVAAALIFAADPIANWSNGRIRPQANTVNAAEIAPGTNRATLTLADGQAIDLSEAQAGIIVGEAITYLDGSLVIDSESEGESREDKPQAGPKTYNLQLTTPKGGTYQITLPDGSRVWLNSASTLSYPSRFEGKERVVQLAGEAYFDVNEARTLTDSQKIPFLVHTQNQVVEVLGTEFNISAYADDPETKTTLVTGSVRVSSDNETLQLSPNQQATLRGDVLQVKQVDVRAYTDWKAGFFSFRETSLTDAMRQLSRWYNLDVAYDESVSEMYFFGKIKRDNNLNKVLSILEKSGLNCRITNENNRIKLTVLP